MWLIQITCSAIIGAAQPCDIYPGPANATLSELQTHKSEIQFRDHRLCERVAFVIAGQDMERTGNSYAAECVRR